MLDVAECERARVRRDRRYDGRFCIGVRKVCPVLPCLRHRPIGRGRPARLFKSAMDNRV